MLKRGNGIFAAPWHHSVACTSRSRITVWNVQLWLQVQWPGKATKFQVFRLWGTLHQLNKMYQVVSILGQSRLEALSQLNFSIGRFDTEETQPGQFPFDEGPFSRESIIICITCDTLMWSTHKELNGTQVFTTHFQHKGKQFSTPAIFKCTVKKAKVNHWKLTQKAA